MSGPLGELGAFDLVVIHCTTPLQEADELLGSALVAVVGGTRPPVSTAMVARYLFDRFDISAEDADVCRHDPEDFVVHFRNRDDRDCILVSTPGGGLLPLIWRPWRQTSLASIGRFHFRVLVGLW